MKKFISILFSVLLCLTFLVGCSTKDKDDEKETSSVVTEVKVAAPDGLPAIAMAKLAKEDPIIKDGYKSVYTVEKTPDALSTAVMKESVDIAIVPSNMAAIAYNKTSNYNIAGTVGMGSFYLVSAEGIKDYSDLVGKSVGNTGKGLTPDMTVKSILKAKNINPEDIKFEYMNSANELVPLLATGKLKTGFIPEPALTALMAKNPDVKIIKSLNDSWKEVYKSKNGYPQSTVIVKSDFYQNNKEYVDDFLGQLSNSIDWSNENKKEVGYYAKDIGVTTKPEVVSKAIERANLKFISIEDTIKDYDDYYKKLSEFDPKTVGGKVPDEGIYLNEE